MSVTEIARTSDARKREQGAAMPEQQSTEVATRSTEVQVRGLYRDTGSLQEAFEAAGRRANLLAPVCRIDFIPELHSISLRVVMLNPTPPDSQGKTAEAKNGGGDVYLQDNSKKDELSLTKVALDKVAAAAGISWDAQLSGRMDTGSDPHYAHFRAVGWIVDFDGSRRQISGEKVVDLRKGSATIGGWSDKRVAGQREHIVSLAESKAKNRAIRQALMIRQKYSPADLAKPFVIPKLVFTGETQDPELKRIVASKMADRALGITSQVYGPDPAEPAAIEGPAQAGDLGRREPPPVSGAVDPDDEDRDAAAAEAARPIAPDCHCPDAPNGVHEEACKHAPAAQQETAKAKPRRAPIDEGLGF